MPVTLVAQLGVYSQKAGNCELHCGVLDAACDAIPHRCTGAPFRARGTCGNPKCLSLEYPDKCSG